MDAQQSAAVNQCSARPNPTQPSPAHAVVNPQLPFSMLPACNPGLQAHTTYRPQTPADYSNDDSACGGAFAIFDPILHSPLSTLRSYPLSALRLKLSVHDSMRALSLPLTLSTLRYLPVRVSRARARPCLPPCVPVSAQLAKVYGVSNVLLPQSVKNV